MIESLSLTYLLLIFGVCVVIYGLPGSKLSKTADILSTHFGLGEALGGMLLLAIVTNFPKLPLQ